MSTETVYYSSANDIKAAELRRRQAEAREARRKAAELKAERKAQEVARRRIATANLAIYDQELLFQREVARLDEATQRLPDLSMATPVLPNLEMSNYRAPEDVEAYAAIVAIEVGLFTKQLDSAIVESERLLQRRLATAEAWREVKDLENNAELRKETIDALAGHLKLVLEEITLPLRPDTNAELEDVQAYLEAIKQSMAEINRKFSSLISCQQSRERASELSGTKLHSSKAENALKEHQASLLASAKITLRQTLDQALNSYEMCFEELPKAIQLLIEDTIEKAGTSDKSEQLIRWVAREKQHLDAIQKSLSMMQNIPELVHENEHLSYRWSRLVERLQRVAGGIDEFEPDLDREYSQIFRDTSRKVCSAYTRSDWMCAMSKQGFEVFERENGQGLVVVDLNNLDVWLEADEVQSKEGAGFGVSMELKTDADNTPDQEGAITENVCSRLGQVKDATAENANGQGAIIARTPKITRGKRPAKALKTFQKHL